MNGLRFSLPFAGSLCIAALLAGTGCTPDRGSTGGRIDAYETTRADLNSNKASLPALLEFGDKTAEQLARDLADIDQITESEDRVVLELGTIVNNTNTPTQDFEQMQRRLRNALRKNRIMREQFMFVESGARMDVEKRRTTGDGPPDLLQEGGRPQGTDRYGAEATYVLQGDFSEARRGNRSQYYLNFQLVNVKSREIVFNNDYDLGQVRPR